MNDDGMTHAERNADGHAASILEMYRAWKALNEGEATAQFEGEEYTDTGDLTSRATEAALDAQVREGWHQLGTEADDGEFQILLTWGGPALRIIGALEGGEPSEAEFEIQDWGTPWTGYEPRFAAADDEQEWPDALLWFVGCFYFGE